MSGPYRAVVIDQVAARAFHRRAKGKRYPTNEDALKDYEQYMLNRKPSDPFWTFSGWLQGNGHTVLREDLP